MDIPSSYARAAEGLGTRDRRKVANNTWTERRGADAIAVRLHGTDVVTHRADGWSILRTGGWDSHTTWNRINAALPGPFACYANRGRRDVYVSGRRVTPYADGIAVRPDPLGIGLVQTDGIAELMGPGDIAAVMAAADAAADERAARIAERIRRQHPAARPVTYRPDVPHARSTWGLPLVNPHGRNYPMVCPSCDAERAEWRAIRRATLEADHDARHAWSVELPNGGTMSEPAGECPWDCPRRGARS